MNDFSPQDAFDRTLRFWWVVAITMVIGGLLGWSLSFLFPPVFEAIANYQVKLDEEALLAQMVSQKPDAELDYITREKYLSPVELMFYKKEIRDDLAEQAQIAGLNYSPDQFNVSDFNLDRRGWSWAVVVRNRDAETAAKLANLWLQVVDRRLSQLREQSVKAHALNISIRTLASCFDGRDLAEANRCAGTSYANSEEAATNLQALESQYASISGASEGISELVTFEVINLAQVPAHAVLYRTGMLALVGSLLGLIAGVFIIQRLLIKA
jgi:hypothetical protein